MAARHALSTGAERFARKMSGLVLASLRSPPYGFFAEILFLVENFSRKTAQNPAEL
jgi:hypothetical protein